jgi:hypothetical protein
MQLLFVCNVIGVTLISSVNNILQVQQNNMKTSKDCKTTNKNSENKCVPYWSICRFSYLVLSEIILRFSVLSFL